MPRITEEQAKQIRQLLIKFSEPAKTDLETYNECLELITFLGGILALGQANEAEASVKPKIVQVSTFASSDPDRHPRVLVLRDDGTLWIRSLGREASGWRQLPLPEG